MKKLMVVLTALTLAVLAACGGKDPAPSGYDPQTTAQALLDSGAFTQELSQLDADLVSAYLGLESQPEEEAGDPGSMGNMGNMDNMDMFAVLLPLWWGMIAYFGVFVLYCIFNFRAIKQLLDKLFRRVRAAGSK